MDCRETQALLTAFHDGELPVDERARVEAHLRDCQGCRALRAGLARVDREAGVPDPGPAYWDRFNARVMDRVNREGDVHGWTSAEAGRDATDSGVPPGGPAVAVLRPKHGWVRQQVRYFIPAAAAAALVMAIVHYGGMRPVPPPVPQAVSGPAAGGERMAKAGPEPQAAEKAEGAVDERFATAARKERDRRMEPPSPTRSGETFRERASSPPAHVVPSTTTAAEPMRVRTQAERKKPEEGTDVHGWTSAEAGRDATDSHASADVHGGTSAEAGRDATDSHASADVHGRTSAEAGRDAAGPNATVAPMADRQFAAKAESASGMRTGKEPSPVAAPSGVSAGMVQPEKGGAPLAAAPPRAGAPCDLARTLAEREQYRKAEEAQRACLAGDLDTPSRETGLVFLAELLDRQRRFADADAVIAEVDRRFPQSLPLDRYRRQRSMVQKRSVEVPVTR